MQSKFIGAESWWRIKRLLFDGTAVVLIRKPDAVGLALTLPIAQPLSRGALHFLAGQLTTLCFGVPLVVGLAPTPADIVAAHGVVDDFSPAVGHTHEHRWLPNELLRTVAFVCAIPSDGIDQTPAVDIARLVLGVPFETNRAGACLPSIGWLDCELNLRAVEGVGADSKQ